MSSNSDSIFNVLSKIKRNPKIVININNRYDNAVQIFIQDNINVSDREIYFPNNKLMVNRLAQDFVDQHSNLLEYCWSLSGNDSIGYRDVWVTTAHLTKRSAFFIEISFE